MDRAGQRVGTDRHMSIVLRALEEFQDLFSRSVRVENGLWLLSSESCPEVFDLQERPAAPIAAPPGSSCAATKDRILFKSGLLCYESIESLSLTVLW
jgi:hypothetical protein